MSSIISVLSSFTTAVIDLVSIIVNFIMFLLFAIKSIFSLVGRVILKIFSLDFWDDFLGLFQDLPLYIGDYTIILLSIFIILMLIKFYKFILGLFKGRSEGKYKEY